MLYKLLLTVFLNLGLLGTAAAQTYWLNMVTGGESMSLPVFSDSKCTEAVNGYVRSNLVNFVSCDVEPLPDAVNLGE